MEELDCIYDSLLDIKNEISELQNDITEIQNKNKNKRSTECSLENLKNLIYKKYTEWTPREEAKHLSQT